MAKLERVYGPVENKTDLKKVFEGIRQDVERATSREMLTELYRRAGYLVTLTYSPAWKKHLGDEIDEIRRFAAGEFRKTARAINRRAKEIGTEPTYDETWGEGRT